MISGRIPHLLSCAAIIGLLISSNSHAADLDATLQLIKDASSRFSYQGTMTQQRIKADGDTLKFSQRIAHQRPDRDRIDILEPNSERGIVMIRLAGEVYRRESAGDTLSYSRRSQFGPDVLDMGLDFSSLDLVRANYHLTLSNTDSILNRPAMLLTITPRHPGRLTRKAWIDALTGLVLHTADQNESGAVVDELFFTSLRINPLIDPALFETHEWKGKAVEVNEVIACGSYAEVQKEAGFTLAAPVYLPPGFTLERLRVLRYTGQPLVHFMYTDGVAQLSLFERIAPASDQAAQSWPGGRPERTGNIQVWKRPPQTILRRHNNGLLFTVVSSIAQSESIKLIESLYALKAPPEDAASNGKMLWMAGGATGLLFAAGWIFWRRRSPD